MQYLSLAPVQTLLRHTTICSVLVCVLVACAFPGTTPPATTQPNTAPSTGSPGEVAPTVPPAPDLLERGLERRAVRDDEQAAFDFHTLLEHYPDVPEARRARYYLAESYARRGHWTSAIEAFHTFVAEPVQDGLTAPALFWLARSYEDAGDWRSAADTYERYRTYHTPIEPYAAIRQATQYEALGQTDQAVQGFLFAATSDIDRGQRAASYEHAIRLLRQQGDDQQALQQYEALLELAQLPVYRARILSEAATLAEAVGDIERARGWQHEIVSAAVAEGPVTSYAVGTVEHLLAVGDPGLASADAARIFFFAEYYETALPHFDAAIQQAQAALPAGAGPDEALLQLQRLRALTLRALDRLPDALDALAAVGEASPDSEAGRQAQLDWIQTLGWTGEVQQAADAYQTYATTYPDDWRAPVALDRAVQLLERLNNTEGATTVRLRLGQNYPESDLAPLALSNAGAYFYEQQRYSEALAAWQVLAANPYHPVDQARGAFWGARAARALQQHDNATTLFEQAFAAAPDSYYGARAAEELHLPPEPPVVAGSPISPQEWHDLETWVAGWSGQPVPQPEPQPQPEGDGEQSDPPHLLEHHTIQRATALIQVGLLSEAIGEWNTAREMWAEEPANLMWLARIAHERGVPYIALKAAEQLAAMSPPDAPPPPTALRRLIYPMPFADLMLEQSRVFGIDPRMLCALIRQESLFNPRATSWVGARGLGQIMPSTGEGIAAQLGIEGFHVDDLYRPYISVQFSAYYISQQIQGMSGSIVGALSAYNGGPGNAQRWAGGNHVADSDQFVERIDYNETRNYVKRVYGYYGAYKRLYALP